MLKKILLASLLFAIPQAKAFDKEKFLKAISIVESNQKPWVIGKKGERSQYQFMRSTWYQYTAVDFIHASDPKMKWLADEVAHEHLNWIINRLKANRKPITYRTCAAAWNSGMTNLIRGKVSLAYVRRFEATLRSL